MYIPLTDGQGVLYGGDSQTLKELVLQQFHDKDPEHIDEAVQCAAGRYLHVSRSYRAGHTSTTCAQNARPDNIRAQNARPDSAKYFTSKAPCHSK